MRKAYYVVVLAACAHNPGVPRFDTERVSALAVAGRPLPSEGVRLEMRALPWWTVAGTSDRFVLAFDDPGRSPTPGRKVGEVRSRDVSLSPEVFAAARCAWQIVPMGDPRPCPTLTREEARELSRPAIEEARAELRAKAGDVGASVVGDVRCFADGRMSARLWCEGVAIDAVIDGRPRDPDVLAMDREPRVPPSRFAVLADGSVGMLRDTAVVGTTLGIRYAPFELGLYILDLQRETVAPMDRGRIGIGMTALGRVAIAHSRFDALVGLSALGVTQNGATNPSFDGLYHGFLGVAYQTPWRLGGMAQPFVQLRLGAAAGSAIEQRAVPMIELHLGLSSPERR